MKSTVPLFEDDFRRNSAIWSAVWDAAEYACEQVRAFPDFIAPGCIDHQLAPDLWRYYAKRRLHQLGIQNAEYIPEHVARNGLAFHYCGLNFRFWKKGRDRVPRGGRSRTKVKFLSQQPPLLAPAAFLSSDTVLPNRVILYEVDGRFNLKRLWYALTLQGSTEHPTLTYWIHEVTFPMIEQFGVRPSPSRDPLPTEDDNLPFRPAAEVDGDELGERDDDENEGAAGVVA